MNATALKADSEANAVALIAAALPGFEALLEEAVAAVRQKVLVDGRISSAKLEQEQHAAHGLSWLATYVMALRELKAYGERLQAEDRYGAIEDYAIRIGAGEYAAQIFGGIPMSQGEIVRLPTLGLSAKAVAAACSDAAEQLIAEGNTPENRARFVALFSQSQGLASVGDPGLDETLEAIRSEMRRFCEQQVTPHAHEWHLQNAYIPLEIVEKVAELGVFGLTLPEEYGGLGLGKLAMCVVSEELSRGYIGVGSLGTRAEIAGELILQQRHGRAERKVSAEDRHRRDPADGGVHGTEHGLGPRLAQDARGEERRRLQDHGPEDVDHASRPRRHHDGAGTHEPGREGLQGPLDAHRREAARLGREPVPGRRHDRRRDRGARLSRHEGVRHLLRRLRGAGCRTCSAAPRGRASSSS
jgi:hypothetical protein